MKPLAYFLISLFALTLCHHTYADDKGYFLQLDNNVENLSAEEELLIDTDLYKEWVSEAQDRNEEKQLIILNAEGKIIRQIQGENIEALKDDEMIRSFLIQSDFLVKISSSYYFRLRLDRLR
jgi:hypothetical protein